MARLFPHQEALLKKLVDAYHTLLPRRMSFLLLHLADGRDDEALFHEGFPGEEDHAHEGDIVALARAGFLQLRYRDDELEFDLTPKAVDHVERMTAGDVRQFSSAAAVQCVLDVTGRVQGRRTLVRIGESEVYLSDAIFRALIVLTIRVGRPDEWTDLEDISNSDNPHQTVSELRKALGHALFAIGFDVAKVIEVADKKARLSIPKDSIKIDLDELQKHHHAEIRQAAADAESEKDD